jgi:hypothetical protein
MSLRPGRILGWILVSLLMASAGSASEPVPELVTITGKARLLSSRLKELGITADEDSIARQVVVEQESQKSEALLPDMASRALILDERLRDREVEVIGRRHAGLPYFQVMSFRVKEEGRWRTPEYYCDICTISVRYPQICPCCQGPMDLRMKPEAP